MNSKEIIPPERRSWTRTAAMIFCIIAALAAAYIIFKYLFGLILPFLLGAGLGALASWIASRLLKHTRAPKRTVSLAVLLILMGSSVGILFFGVRRLLTELGKLAEGIGAGEGPIYDFFAEAVELIGKLGEKIASLFPNIGSGDASATAEQINAFIEGLVGDTISAIGSAIPGILSAILKSLPDLLIGLIVTVIAAFYFTLDGKRIKSGIRTLLPSSAGALLAHIKKEAAIAAIGYLRSYSLILLITFAEIFFGLSVLGVEYSFLIAAISAIVDILPVLGVGVVLLPWALFCLITKDVFLGVGLIILYVIIVFVRQFIEPKIVGENLGIHPLLTLAAFYLGYRLFGFTGIILAPIVLVLWKTLKTYSSAAGITHT